MAGRKVFTSGEILTAADVNSYLMDQSVMVFADSTARSSAIPTPSEGMVTYVEDANRVEVYDGSAFGPIGGILQVVSTTKTDTFSLSSTSFTDVTGLSVSITPSSTSSKIFVIADISMGTSAANWRQFQIVRDSTPIAIGDSAGSRTRSTGSQYFGTSDPTGQIGKESASTLDSPNTASSTTYKIQIRAASGTVYVNRSDANTDSSSNARTASSITVMEVAV